MNMNMSQMSNTLEKQPRRILEIGAGGAPLIEDLKKHGIDVTDAVITDMEKKTQKYVPMGTPFRMNDPIGRHKPRDPELLYVVAKASQLPFRDNTFTDIIAVNFFGDVSFDISESSDVYKSAFDVEANHESVEILFKELARVLKAEGKICVFENNTMIVSKVFFDKHRKTWEKFFSYTDGSLLVSKDFTDSFSDFYEGHSVLFTLTKK